VRKSAASGGPLISVTWPMPDALMPYLRQLVPDVLAAVQFGGGPAWTIPWAQTGEHGATDDKSGPHVRRLPATGVDESTVRSCRSKATQ
jgi:hypothetical protein